MKKIQTIPLAALLFFCFCFAQCHKDKTPAPDNPYGLPNATQEGKNTLGFLLNGVPWTPKGFNGTANLSIDFDPGFNDGTVGIAAYRITGEIDQAFGIGVADSLNAFSYPKTIKLSNTSLGRVRFRKDLYTIFSTDATFVDGNLVITKLDRISRIISGTFNAILFEQGQGDTIRITNGRFDMRY